MSLWLCSGFAKGDVDLRVWLGDDGAESELFEVVVVEDAFRNAERGLWKSE